MRAMNGVQRIRQQLQMTQTELAAAISITQSAVSQYERGEAQIAPQVAKRLIDLARSRRVKATYDDIYGGKAA